MSDKFCNRKDVLTLQIRPHRWRLLVGRASESVAKVIIYCPYLFKFLPPFSTSSHMVSHPPDPHEPHWLHLPVEIVKRIFELARHSSYVSSPRLCLNGQYPFFIKPLQSESIAT